MIVEAATEVALGNGARYAVLVATQAEYEDEAVMAVKADVSSERQLEKSMMV